jgi:tRNA A37 threonylcarbamoyladenosine biosynthesis protein TsaE
MTEDGVLAVEWPERGEWALPVGDVIVKLEVRNENERALSLEAGSDRGREIIQALGSV